MVWGYISVSGFRILFVLYLFTWSKSRLFGAFWQYHFESNKPSKALCFWFIIYREILSLSNNCCLLVSFCFCSGCTWWFVLFFLFVLCLFWGFFVSVFLCLFFYILFFGAFKGFLNIKFNIYTCRIQALTLWTISIYRSLCTLSININICERNLEHWVHV